MSPIRVIIIDDERMIAKLLKDYLEDYGFYVEKAETGKEGLAIIAGRPFDAAIVDLRMPDMEGSEVVSGAISIQPKIKCFIHTGSIDFMPDEELTALGIDADSIIRKPILDMGEICRKIESRVRGK